MKFVLAGFSQKDNIRHYSFQGIGDDRRTRTEFSVGVDLNLLHKHGIPLQEAPLLCCFLLGSQLGHEELRLMFSEADMLARAEQRATELVEAQTKRKPTYTQASLSPVRADSGNGKFSIGLGSRTASPLVARR